MDMISCSSKWFGRSLLHGLWLAMAALLAETPCLLDFCIARSAPQPLHRFEFTETHMGSPVHIVLYTTETQTAKNAARSAYARVAQLDQIFSDYNPQSELMKLVDHFAGSLV